MGNRRNFMAKSGAALAATVLSPLPSQGTSSASRIIHAKGKPAEATRKAIDGAGGIHTFVSSGDRVVLKANMGFPNPPEWSTTTHPDVVQTVAGMCLEAGARRVIVLDHPLRDAQMCREKSGIEHALKGMKGVVLAMLEEEKFYTPIEVPGAQHLKKTAIARELLKADCFINIPTAKSHSATGVSLGLKNLMGLLWDRTAMHEHMELDTAIAELLLVKKLYPALTVMDAVYALTTHGPGGPGKVEQLDTVVAGTDPVAVDSYTVGLARWYNQQFTGKQVRHIQNAYDQGSGEIDVEKMDVVEV